MSYEINLEGPPAGYCLTYARAGESVPIAFREFTSTEDGQHFIQRLEGTPDLILQNLPTKIYPSTVDNMLAICRRDGSATVYVNELEIRADVRAARSVEAGEGVSKDDIADIERLELGVQIPQDTGFLFVFSIGWRKGLFYDFGPVGPKQEPREYDVAPVLAQAYCHVLFQERFSISDAEWEQLLAARWFPFISLSNDTIDSLISHARSGWGPDEILGDIVSEVRNRAPQMLDSWRGHSALSPHIEILERAVARFLDGDPMSCTALLYPRIEGILRGYNNSLGTPIRPSQDNLSDLTVAAKSENEKCLLLPHRFNTYLRDVYFAAFDPISSDIDASRNSVGHGVASISTFDEKSAVIGILIVHQIFYFLDSKSSHQTQDGTAAEDATGTK